MTLKMLRAQVLLALAALSCCASLHTRAKAQEPGGIYVQTTVLKFLVVERGTPRYEAVHTSEGPFEPLAAQKRKLEIGTQGLDIGIHYYPVHLVQLVELQSN